MRPPRRRASAARYGVFANSPIATALTLVEAKRTRKERWMDRIIADLDRQYSGIASAIVQREMSTAETFHQYLNTPGGAL